MHCQWQHPHVCSEIPDIFRMFPSVSLVKCRMTVNQVCTVCATTKYAVVVLRFDIRFPCSEGTVGCPLASTSKYEIEVLEKTELYMFLTVRPWPT